MEKEIFKKVPIPVYCNYYKISNYGRLWSDRKQKFMVYHKTDYGHLETVLSVDGQQKGVRCHELVAKAFIPNPENKTQVHHIDGNPENNYFENLMWVTPQEHAIIHENWKYGNDINSKSIYQYALSGELISEYPSMNEAARQVKGSQGNIWSCCNGIQKTAYGYQWSYEKFESIPSVEIIEKRRWKNRAKAVCQYTTDGTFVAEYVSAAEAGRITNIESSNIRNCCRGYNGYKRAGGFVWRYKKVV